MNSWNGITYKERRLIEILNMISDKAKKGKIPQCVVDKAIVLFKKISENQIRRGQSLVSIIASCLRLAIKYHSIQDIDITRSINELAKLFNLDEKKFKEGYNQSFEIMYQKDPEFIKKIKEYKKTITLNTEQQNYIAIKFYQKNNFKIEKLRINYYENLTCNNAYFMKYYISN